MADELGVMQQVAKQNGYQCCYSLIISHCTSKQQDQLKVEEDTLQCEAAGVGNASRLCSRALSSKQTMLTDLCTNMRNVTLKQTTPSEKHIFSSVAQDDVGGRIKSEQSPTTDTITMASFTYTSSPRQSLSKLVEFPGDVDCVRQMLECQSPCAVDPAGKDMFGVAAIHKFSSWNKVDLLKLLVPHLTTDALNAKG